MVPGILLIIQIFVQWRPRKWARVRGWTNALRGTTEVRAMNAVTAAKRSDAEDAEDVEDAEADAAMFIKAKCEVGKLFAGRLSDPAEDHAAQFAYYERIRDACIACTDKLNDEFYRGFAIHQIIDMCVAAGGMAVARALLLAVHDDFLREKIFESAPALRPSSTLTPPPARSAPSS